MIDLAQSPMKSARPFWEQRYLRVGLMCVAWTFDCVGAPSQCNENMQTDFSAAMVVKPSQAYLAPSPTNANASRQKARWLAHGDVVLVEKRFAGEGAALVSEWPTLVCAAHGDARGQKTYGWLRRDELLEVSMPDGTFSPVDDSFEGNQLVAKLPPVRTWPRGGRTASPTHYDNDNHASEGFVGDYLCVERIELKLKKLCVATTPRWLSDDECGDLTSNNRIAHFEAEGLYTAFLLNNAIIVASERGMWGNHGQSDPEGIYLLSQSANRYCKAEAWGPSFWSPNELILPGKGLGKLSLQTISNGSGSVEKILGKPTQQDVERRILVYHSKNTQSDLLIDTLEPAIEFTSPDFRTARGVAINSVEFYPQQFDKVRDEANGATRYIFRRGGLAFLVFDEPMETTGGAISRLGVIGRDAATRSPALRRFVPNNGKGDRAKVR